MPSVFKLVSLLFPFIREMILGDKTFKLALRENKLKVLLLALILFCLGWTFYSIPRMVRIAAENVALDGQLHQLRSGEQAGKVVAASASVVAKLHETSKDILGKSPTIASPVKHVFSGASLLPAIAPLSPSFPVAPSTPSMPVVPQSMVSTKEDWNARQRAWLAGLDDIRREDGNVH